MVFGLQADSLLVQLDIHEATLGFRGVNMGRMCFGVVVRGQG